MDCWTTTSICTFPLREEIEQVEEINPTAGLAPVCRGPRLLVIYPHLMMRIYLVYATREPPKMAQFHWFAISGYWAISHDLDLKLGILRDGCLVTLLKTNKPLIRKNNPGRKCYLVYFWSVQL